MADEDTLNTMPAEAAAGDMPAEAVGEETDAGKRRAKAGQSARGKAAR